MRDTRSEEDAWSEFGPAQLNVNEASVEQTSQMARQQNQRHKLESRMRHLFREEPMSPHLRCRTATDHFIHCADSQ
jgi:hypothetical protein